MRAGRLTVAFVLLLSHTFSMALRAQSQALPDTIQLTLPVDGIVQPPRVLLPYRTLKRPKIGLALSGGGARSLAQIGVLEILEQNGIPVDFVAGTSLGSVVGGLYAAGFSAEEIWDFAKRVEWDRLTKDRPPRTALFLGQKQERDRVLLQVRLEGLKPHLPHAFTPGQRLAEILTDLTLQANYAAGLDFDRLAIPYRAVATDLITGEKVVLSQGDLAEAMLASAAVPLLFSPVVRDGHLLVDGGLVDNLPVDVVREMGADIVVAIDASSKLRSRDQIKTPWEVADQVITIMMRPQKRRLQASADLVIRIPDDHRSATDFNDLDSLRALGKEAALQALPRLRALIRKASLSAVDSAAVLITRVETDTPPLSADGAASTTSKLLTPGRYRFGELRSNLRGLYQTGFFQDVSATLIRQEDGYLLHYHLQPNPVLRRIQIQGNTALRDTALLSTMTTKPGRVLNLRHGRDDLRRITQLYAAQGYSLARVKQVRFDRTVGLLSIEIEEGHIDKIELEGNARTQDYVILREFPLKPGDIFNIQDANRGIRQIYSTGLFDRVQLSLSPSPKGPVVHIKLREKRPTFLRFSLRYGTERKMQTFLEVGNDNLFGTGANLVAHASYGELDQLYSIRFRMDRLFETYLTSDVNLHHRVGEYSVYSAGRTIGTFEERRTGLVFSLGQQIRRLGAVSLGARLERVAIHRLQGDGYDSGTHRIASLTLRSVVDDRDQMPFPNRGRLVRFYYETSGRLLGSEQSFAKVFASVEAYRTFRQHHTFMARFTWGSADQTTPFSEQFRVGGEELFYGLSYGEWIGRHFVVGSLGYRFRIPSSWLLKPYVGVRFDLGGVWKTRKTARSRDLQRAVGVRIAWDTLIGPISLSAGRISSGKKRVYLSVGFKF